MQPAGVHRIFFQLYPSSACHVMAHAFMRAYDDAGTPKKPMVIAARANAAAAA